MALKLWVVENRPSPLLWPLAYTTACTSRDHLEFRKNVNNFGLDKDILHQIKWEDAPRRRGDDYVTKSQNRKLIRVTSSNEGLQHICIDLSDYNRYLDQIWYRTQIPHYQHARMAKFTQTKNSRWRRPPS